MHLTVNDWSIISNFPAYFFLICFPSVLVVVNHYMAFQYFAQEYYPFSEVKSSLIYDIQYFHDLFLCCLSLTLFFLLLLFFSWLESRCWPTSPSASGWSLSLSLCLSLRVKMCFRPPCSKEVRYFLVASILWSDISNSCDLLVLSDCMILLQIWSKIEFFTSPSGTPFHQSHFCVSADVNLWHLTLTRKTVT